MKNKTETVLKTNEAQAKLLPCPFCGNTPYVKFRPSRRGQPAEAELYHDNAKCPVVVLIKRSCQKEEHIIKLWNTRARG